VAERIARTSHLFAGLLMLSALAIELTA